MSKNNPVFKRAIFRSILRKNPRIGLCIAGGGCKAFFALGVCEILRREGMAFDALSATSAGTAMAITLLKSKSEELVSYFCDLVSRNKANIHFGKLVKGKRPFPHERMYRDTIRRFVDMDALHKIRSRIFYNALLLPNSMAGESAKMKRAAMVMKLIGAYRKEDQLAEKGMYRPLMQQVAVESGLDEVIFTNSDFTSAERLEEIILATSSAPPFTKLQVLDGKYFLDGGVYDNLPIRLLPDDLDLVIAIYYNPATREITQVMKRDQGKNVFWVHPHGPLPVAPFDYTDPRGVKLTYELGKRTGENILRLLRAYL